MYPLVIHSTDMKTDELLDMISSIARKKNKIRGNLRIEVLLEETYKKIDKELKQKQLKRKRKWEEMKMEMCKKARIAIESCVDVTSTKIHEDDDDDDPFELNGFFQRLKSATPNVPEVVTAFHCSVSRKSRTRPAGKLIR
ncbi:uncharacterized protein [Centruroides vittatus]|uniref:uncharacterized protein n=1 Tax=Centruroides vittatus TaxID=120091 RepID=UPI0035107E45